MKRFLKNRIVSSYGVSRPLPLWHERIKYLKFIICEIKILQQCYDQIFLRLLDVPMTETQTRRKDKTCQV